LAKELSTKGHEKTEKMKLLQKESAEAIFKAKNKGREVNELDLHGLQVEQAVMLVNKHLQKIAKLRSKGFTTLHIITGKGLHSSAEIRLLPAVQELLQSKGIPNEYQEEEGFVLVLLENVR